MVTSAAFDHTKLPGNSSIQVELKMTVEQIKQAAETRDELLSKFSLRGSSPFSDPEGYAKIYTERSKTIEAAIGKLLSAAQAKRFRVSEGVELARLVIHGLLHLAGLDHQRPGERRVMRVHEDEALRSGAAAVRALDRVLSIDV